MMRLPCFPRALAGLALVTCLLAGGFAIAADGERSPQTIYQQRLPDGRVVFTDRPEPGAVTERDWNFVPDDPAQAAARREAARAEAMDINHRVQRATEFRQQLDHQLEIERLRRAQALALLEAERERTERQLAQQAPAPVVVVPGWHRPWLPSVRHPPRSPWEPGYWSAPAPRPVEKPAALNVPRPRR